MHNKNTTVTRTQRDEKTGTKRKQKWNRNRQKSAEQERESILNSKGTVETFNDKHSTSKKNKLRIPHGMGERLFFIIVDNTYKVLCS